MQKGFSAPIVLLIVLFLLILPIGFWLHTNKINLVTSSASVKGVSINANTYAKPGISVNIIANTGAWDLTEYLCKSLEECKLSLTSGTRWGVVSGGQTKSHEISIDSSPEWKDYQYIKYYVKPGWHSETKEFHINNIGEAPDSEIYVINEGNSKTEVAIVKLEALKTHFYKSATFSDSN